MPSPASPPPHPADARRAEWRLAAWVFAAALPVRLLYLAWIADPGNPFYDAPVVDAMTYDAQARRIAAGELAPGRAFYQPPLYPYLLGGLYALFGRDLTLVRLLQLALGAGTAALSAVLARRLAGPVAGVAAGAWLLAYGPLLFFEGEILVPALFLFLNAWALLALVPREGGVPSPARAGLLLGLSAVALPTVLLFAAPAGLWLALQGERSRALARGALFAGFLLLPIAPVALYNGLVAKEPVLVSANGGINFYLGNNPHYDQSVAIRPGVEWKKLMREPRGVVPDLPSLRSSYWLERGLAWLREQPLDAAALYAKKAVLLLGAHEIPRNLDYYFFAERFAPWLTALPHFGWLLPPAALGLGVTWPQRRRFAVPYLFVASYSLAILLFFVTGRYRLPLVPLLAVFAGCGLAWALEEIRLRRRLLRLLGAAVGVLAVAVGMRVDWFGVARVDESEGWNLLGLAHANAGRHAEAIGPFREALRLDPENVGAHFNLARNLQLTGEPLSAIAHYRRVLERYPEDWDALHNLGTALMAIGAHEEAVAPLARARALYPKLPRIDEKLARARKGARDPTRSSP